MNLHPAHAGEGSQYVDAFGVPLERIALSSCDRPTCPTCHPDRARAEFGELGYRGQEGYRTRIYDADRFEDLPNANPDHPDFDSHSPNGYEDYSTGFIQVGARDYDPEIGRFLQPDPIPIGSEVTGGVLNRWTYCANDPVNSSDPTGSVAVAIPLLAYAYAVVSAILLAVLAYVALLLVLLGLSLIDISNPNCRGKCILQRQSKSTNIHIGSVWECAYRCPGFSGLYILTWGYTTDFACPVSIPSPF